MYKAFCSGSVSEYPFRRLKKGKTDDIKTDISESGCKRTEGSFGGGSVEC